MIEVLTKIEIIARPTKFEELKQALAQIGVSGITVTMLLVQVFKKVILKHIEVRSWMSQHVRTDQG